MFSEISLMAWMSGAIVFAIGGGAGFFIARQIKDKHTLGLEEQLEAAQNRLNEYQDEVNRHFIKTSLLFNKLTDNYREVYEHLATGAQKLCNDKPLTTALDLPETKILAATVTADASAAITSEEKTETDTVTPILADTGHTDATPTPGDEAVVAAEEIATASTETASAEDTDLPEKTVEEQTATEPAIVEPVVTTSATETSDDAPGITEEELKTLEANDEQNKKSEEEDDAHLGAESTPGVNVKPEHHKTHPSIH